MEPKQEPNQKCIRCRKLHPQDSYISARDGLIKKHCKTCRTGRIDIAENSKAWRQRLKESGIKYEKRTAEERREYFRQYRLKNPEAYRKYIREYRSRKKAAQI